MEEFSMPQSILQIVSEKGFDGLQKIMQLLCNEAMKMERENYLHAGPYQRTMDRTDYAKGFKPCTINTLQGEIQLAVPQRSRLEHVFGVIHQRAGDVILRTVGISMAEVKLGLRNLAYNMDRFCTLMLQNT